MKGVLELLDFSPWYFSLGIVIYVIIHVAYYYMGGYGKTWEMRKNNKKAKKNRTPL